MFTNTRAVRPFGTWPLKQRWNQTLLHTFPSQFFQPMVAIWRKKRLFVLSYFSIFTSSFAYYRPHSARVGCISTSRSLLLVHIVLLLLLIAGGLYQHINRETCTIPFLKLLSTTRFLCNTPVGHSYLSNV